MSVSELLGCPDLAEKLLGTVILNSDHSAGVAQLCVYLMLMQVGDWALSFPWLSYHLKLGYK